MKKPIPFGKYYLLERINVGGMAEVFRAKAYGVEGFERLVAVKRILSNIAEDKEFISMFIDEAKLAVQLNHANIAQIFDLGVVNGAYYIALEHIHGRDLRAIFDCCRQGGQAMPIAQAAFVIMKVCEGLDYAHNKRDQSGRELGLVHRDVSPQNVLVSFEGEVKLIDFGIAKAAGKGAKTQKGILKGKFGYMSPEQVRGLPIDRRSDVFSCGIVLYELLTGERLFVGESDFSTLEKVRNVEILPPNTYNRKIPDELERIVLKALAKDVDDRYSNAIDLHDDLQAFVYTAGEFYSRKDLAAWMKNTFARQIEEETAKLEAYRQLRPPEMRSPVKAPAGRRGLEDHPDGPRRATLAMPSVASAPPPPPPGAGGQRRAPAARLPSQPPSSPAVSPAALPGTPPPPPPPGGQGKGLVWDEEEIETGVYAESSKPPAGHASTDVAATMQLGGAGTSARARRSRTPAAGVGAQPGQGDAGSPNQTAKGWESATNPSGAPVEPPPPPPSNIAIGSSPERSPFQGPDSAGASGGMPPVASDGTVRDEREIIAFHSVSLPEVAPRPRRKGLYIGLAAFLLLALGAGGAVVVKLGTNQGAAAAAGGRGDEVDESPAGSPIEPSGESLSVSDIEPTATPLDLGKDVLAQTGFDLIVTPKDVTVKLDGKQLGMTPPMKVRNIAPGDHQLVINGPRGFFSKQQFVTVEAGKAEKLEIRLEPVEIVGTFESDPPAADVTLLVNKEQEVALGKSPATYKLEPGNSYDVRFEKKGYVTKTEPVPITGNSKETIVAVLEPAGKRSGRERSRRRSSDGDDDKKAASGKDGKRTGDKTGGTTSTSGGDSSSAGRPGTLALGAKPPCEIYIDGQNTGKRTPQRNLSLSPGKHRITLVNNEHGIKESFSVNIKSGKTSRHIKDFSDRIK